MSIILRKKRLKNGESSLYLDYYLNGKRKYEFLNLRLGSDKDSNKEILKLAESIKAKRLLEINADEHGFITLHRRKMDFITFFKSEVNERPPDRTSWSCTKKKLERFSGGKLMFSEINDDWLLRFQKFLLSEVGALTAHHYYSNLKTALNKAVRLNYISNNPCNKVKNIKKPDVKREFLEFDEIQTLANNKCSNSEVKRAFLFSCFTGLRFSDVNNLTWRNVKGDTLEFVQKKTNKLEYLPLSTSAKELLYQVIVEDQTIPHPELKIFTLPTKSRVSEIVRKWVKKSNLTKRISFHTSRHTFATLSLTMGTDLYTVSKLLGHKNISTTQVYANIIDERKREAIEKLPSLKLNREIQ